MPYGVPFITARADASALKKLEDSPEAETTDPEKISAIHTVVIPSSIDAALHTPLLNFTLID
jgi:hypothetical protein